MEKAMVPLFALIMIVAVVGVVQAMQPVPQYTCPICGTQFFTYDELYTHFTTEHPAEPIDLLWT